MANQIDKNISCNIFLEQINLINQLPLEERGNVLYLALLKAFTKSRFQVDNQDDSQLENQLENTYISISKSISLSLSILSKSVLELLNKTIDCKIYKSGWGGKREGAGKPRTGTGKGSSKDGAENKPTKQEIEDYAHNQLGKRIDDIDGFLNWYDAQGWVDKNGFPINWKQKIQSWIRNNSKTNQVENKIDKKQEEIDYSDYSNYPFI